MNHSLATADRTTHLKVVVVALLAAIVVVAVGITARVTAMDTETARIHTQGVVVKAGAPAAYTRTETPSIR
ncbi:MAG TPA: hypothetical protein VG100_15105 [Xanthobacteraceae bacterium]|jgi:heme A synthase|nr:hypothetical protein [Xanthobacteraceae bacterium]